MVIAAGDKNADVEPTFGPAPPDNAKLYGSGGPFVTVTWLTVDIVFGLVLAVATIVALGPSVLPGCELNWANAAEVESKPFENGGGKVACV